MAATYSRKCCIGHDEEALAAVSRGEGTRLELCYGSCPMYKYILSGLSQEQAMLLDLQAQTLYITAEQSTRIRREDQPEKIFKIDDLDIMSNKDLIELRNKISSLLDARLLSQN